MWPPPGSCTGPAHVTGEAIELLKSVHDGPLLAYPGSAYFAAPQWNFEDVMPPEELHRFASTWIEQGVGIIGCYWGLSPEHIPALKPLKN